MTCRDVVRRAGVEYSDFKIGDVSGAVSYDFSPPIDLGKPNIPFVL